MFPKNGIQLGEFKLNFISKSEFISDPLDIEKIAIKVINTDSINQIEQQIKDSIMLVEKIILQQYLDSILEAHKKIQYPNNDRALLFSFFEKLVSAKTKKVRIMHYGDSQIEADRISGRVRERLQKEFGGYGPGAHAVIPATRKISLKNKSSSNWIRRTGFGPYIDTVVQHNNYGALFSFCELSKGSSAIDSNALFDGIIKVYRPTKSYRRCRNYQQLNIYYSAAENILVNYTINDTTFLFDTLFKTDKIAIKTLRFNSAPASLEIQMKSKYSPLIYGLSLEGKKGVLVDNIPLRGASGTEFAKISYSSLKQMHHLLSPDLFILEFGGNAIPHIKTVERAQRYGNYFKKQILKLKKINPKALVLVIGPGDMAKKDKTAMVSYDLIEEVRDALKKAAFETNSCFWDMYLNMGGENSIVKWSKETPSLAARDYIHLTNAGARKIADLFIEDLMQDFELYIKQGNDKK